MRLEEISMARLNEYANCTLVEAAQAMGVSPQRAARIEANAIRKIEKQIDADRELSAMVVEMLSDGRTNRGES